jgi:phosphatidylserine synthase 2
MDDISDKFIYNSKRGVFYAFFTLISFGMLYFRDTIFIRPHFSFWRIIQGMSVCYMMMLTFILFLV